MRKFNAMKSVLVAMAGALALGLDPAPAYGQAPVITGLGRNGELVCTNLLAGSTASVVWASSVLGPESAKQAWWFL